MGEEKKRTAREIIENYDGAAVRIMENDVLWHYRFPHDGWEYDCAVSELYAVKPGGVKDPYTPNRARI